MNATIIQQRVFFAVAGLMFTISLFAGLPGNSAQLTILTILIVFTGLPHGAMDAAIAKHLRVWQKPIGLCAFLGAYIFLALSALILWVKWPLLSLGVFLLISAWHFGQDWRHDLNHASRFAAGMLLMGAPALFHAPAVFDVFEILSNANALALVTNLQYLFLIALLWLVTQSLHTTKPIKTTTTFEISTLIVLAWALPPLLYFSVYFCFLHSPRHLITHTHLLPKKQLVTQTVMLTTITVIAAAVGYTALSEMTHDQRLLHLVFVGLAVLTVPHMLLVDTPIKRRKTHERHA
jgi:Brp/Blh family beta-carotene 15,15'-monooxygenase